MNVRRPLLGAAAGLFLGAAAGLAGAQQSAPPSPEPPRYQETVEVEGRTAVVEQSATLMKLPAPLLETPASVQVVPRAVFQAQDAAVLGEALAGATSLNSATGYGVFDFFVIRGFDSLSSGLVLVDGVPEPESTFYPLYNARQVEVMKGPAASVYGGNALAGAVHIVRKQPQAGRSAQLAAAAGRFGLAEGALDANLAPRDSSLAFRLNGLLRSADSHRERQESDLRAIHPAVTWRPNDATRLSGSFEYVDSEFSPDSGLPLIGSNVAAVPRSRSYQSPLDHSLQDVVRLRLDGEREAGRTDRPARQALRDGAGLAVPGARSSWARSPAPAGPDVYRALSSLEDRQTLVGNQLELSSVVDTGGVRTRPAGRLGGQPAGRRLHAGCGRPAAHQPRPAGGDGPAALPALLQPERRGAEHGGGALRGRPAAAGLPRVGRGRPAPRPPELSRGRDLHRAQRHQAQPTGGRLGRAFPRGWLCTQTRPPPSRRPLRWWWASASPRRASRSSWARSGPSAAAGTRRWPSTISRRTWPSPGPTVCCARRASSARAAWSWRWPPSRAGAGWWWAPTPSPTRS